jgi:hypothetical protein
MRDDAQARGADAVEDGEMTPARLTLALVGAVGLTAAASLQATADPRAVVELFTSQGCSSCPPADKLLGELAADKSILAMSLPIDYWDYLGWKDTLARPRHTARQRGYATMRGDREVYTPQVVVNGAAHVLGSDRIAIESAIRKTRRTAGDTLSVPVTLAVKDEGVDVTVASATGAGAAGEVWLCAMANAVPVAIGRGENRGRTVTYHNVVRKWVRLGHWSGGTQTWTVSKSDFKADDVDSVAVLIQSGTLDSPGTILGAATTPLR